MEQKLEEESAFILIKEQLENYTSDQRENISSCVENCGAKSLVEKLIEIVDNAEKQKEEGNENRKRGPSTSTSISTSASTSQAEIATVQSPVEKAMFTSVVVRHIFSYVDARTLLKLRQVCRLWREEATLLLLSERHEHFFIVKFEWWPEHKNKRFWHKSVSTLSEFMDTCLKNSRIFPCSHFSFQGGKLSHPDLITFFSKYGHHVRHLKLQPHLGKMATLLKVLFKWTPNLKSWIFEPEGWTKRPARAVQHAENESSSEPGSESESDSETEKECKKAVKKGQLEPDLCLPLTLRKIVLPRIPLPLTESSAQSAIISKILTSSPHLTSIEDPLLGFIPEIISAGKLPLVTSLTWNFVQNGDLEENFLNFVAAGPKLTSVTFEGANEPLNPNPSPRLISAVEKLLSLCKNTLTNMTGIQALAQVLGPAAQLPPLSKVNELTLNFGTEAEAEPEPEQVRSRRILPQGHKLAQFLPNLKSMTVELYEDVTSNYPFTSPNDAHWSLKKLKLSNVASDDDPESCFKYDRLPSLRNLYPNVTHLHFAVYKSTGECLLTCLKKAINHHQQLKSLVLEFWIVSFDEIEGDFKTQIDQLLTGLLLGDCERLWSRAGNPNDSEFQEIAATIPRENPYRDTSILNLKQLTSLTFEVHFECGAKQLWTRVTQVFAFQHMAERQGLEVVVRGTKWEDVPLERNDLGPI